MIQFKETPGQATGQTDPISMDPSSYWWGSNKYNCSILVFKSQRYGA